MMRGVGIKLASLLWLALVSASIQAEEKTQAGFESYVQKLKSEALSHGFTQPWINTTFANIKFRPTVIKSDKNQDLSMVTKKSKNRFVSYISNFKKAYQGSYYGYKNLVSGIFT